MSAKDKYIAQEIVDLLALRHSKDVFIPECKDGPTHSASHVRMDAWAMNKSWAHPVVSAYEVKVSRADFLKDNKWPAYLPLCNQFYFVAPGGLIDLSELPAEAGLLTVAGKGKGARLLTKKKAPHRDITIPEEVYRYILMCRVSVGAEYVIDRNDSSDFWRRWLRNKAEDQKLGYEVAKRIRQRATELEVENVRLRAEHEQYQKHEQLLDSLGIDIHHWNLEWAIKSKLEAQQSVFDPSLLNAMREVRNKIDTALTVAATTEEKAKHQSEHVEAEKVAI